MTEIYLPNENPYAKADKLFAEALELLPLEVCKTERNFYLGGLLEFKPPDGQAFRVTGEFESDQGWDQPPQPSRDLYQNLNDTEQEYWEIDNLPTSFIGSRLSLELGRTGLAVYGSPIHAGVLQAPADLTPRIRIASPLEFHSTYGTVMEYAWEEYSGSGRYHIEKIIGENSEIVWGSDNVVGNLSDVQIEIIDHKFPAPKFEVIENSTDREIHTVTAPGGPSKKQMAAYFAAGGMPLSKEGLDAYMRSMRLKGFPLRDDPLRDFRVIQANDNGEIPSYRTLLDLIDREKTIMGETNSTDRELQRRRDYAERAVHRIKGKIASEIVIVDSSDQLQDIVAEHASPGWLERELERRKQYWAEEPVF